MSRAARSLLAFGIYLGTGGVVLLAAPGFACRVLGLGQSPDVWARVTGMLFGILAYYCVRAAREEAGAFFRWSVHTRPTTVVFTAAFVAAGLASPVLVLFGVIDVAAALWTALALRADARSARP